MFDAKEAAKLLGCSVGALYRRIAKGQASKPRRVGGRLFFTSAALLPFVASKEEKWTRKRNKKPGPRTYKRARQRSVQKAYAAKLLDLARRDELREFAAAQADKRNRR